MRPIVLAFVAATACGGSTPAPTEPAPDPPPSCHASAAHVAAIMLDEVARLVAESPEIYGQPPPASFDNHRQGLAADLERSCAGRAWSSDTATCFAQSTLASFEACYVHVDDPTRAEISAHIDAHVQAVVTRR